MTPSTSENAPIFKTYTTTLGILNVCLLLAAILMFVAAIVFYVTSYVFNDSGHVPEAVAPLVRCLFLDSFIAVILFIWQIRVRKALFALQPSARKSMLALGIAYVVVAVINAFQMYLFTPVLAAIGIWWIVVFSRSKTRAAFENPQPIAEILPPPS